MHTRRRHRARRALAGLAAAGAVALAAACGGEADGGGPARVVVTTPVLGSLATSVLGEEAEVRVIMPNGADPHGFEPSARDAEALAEADLVVENGLGLEEGLADAVDRARADGVPVLTATDHVDVLPLATEEHRHHEEGDAEGHADGDEGDAGDPHFWLDPLRMARVARALGDAAEEELGVDVERRATRAVVDLEALDERVARILEDVPEGDRRLATGHASLGYLADRHGLEVVGSVVASASSQGAPSARGVSELARRMRDGGVRAIFAETGAPGDVVRAVAREAGARVVELRIDRLPGDGSYEAYVLGIAERVAAGLGAPPRGS